MTVDPKATARLLRDVIGGAPKVVKYYNADESKRVHVLVSADRPQAGVTTYASVAASGFETNMKTGDGRPIRVEFIAECQASFAAMLNVVGNSALNISDGSYRVKPNMILPNVIAASDNSVRMKHCLVTVPFSWERLPTIVDNGGDVLAFLQLIPASESEMVYAYEHGVAALVQQLRHANVDILDIQRESAV